MNWLRNICTGSIISTSLKRGTSSLVALHFTTKDWTYGLRALTNLTPLSLHCWRWCSLIRTASCTYRNLAHKLASICYNRYLAAKRNFVHQNWHICLIITVFLIVNQELSTVKLHIMQLIYAVLPRKKHVCIHTDPCPQRLLFPWWQYV